MIKWLKQSTEQGVSISQAVAMLRESGVLSDDLPQLAKPVPLSVQPAPSNNSASSEVRNQLLNALLSVNLRQAHLLVNTACTMLTLEAVLNDVFQPLLREAGNRWAAGQLTVIEEHLITNFIRQRLLGLAQLHAPFANGPRLICACAPNEQHEINLLMFALLMEQRGWEIVYLGQNVALDGMGEFLGRAAPAFVCISVTLIEHLPGMIDMCRLIKSYEPNHLTLVYGGHLFELYPEFQQRIPGAFLGPDLFGAANRLEGLAEQVPAAARMIA